jgi:hypothetical protein
MDVPRRSFVQRPPKSVECCPDGIDFDLLWAFALIIAGAAALVV